MITIEAIIAKVIALRQESCAVSVRSPNRERPEMAYGEAVGRDAAFALVLEAIEELAEEDREKTREED